MIKQNFTDQELRGLEVGERFFWSWLPANGHSGGVLIGLRDSVFEVGVVEIGSFFVSASVLRRADKLKLEFMGIYGPADHVSSGRFLEEISGKVARSNLLIIMGGDFNLMRIPEDKNNERINWPRLELFNDHIARWAVREIPRTGARFTWSNHQLNPVRCVLDRVFISIDLEPSFPLCSLVAETSLGSDHTPLVFDSGELCPIRSNRFFFETGWLEGEGFQDTLLGMWHQLLLRVGGRDIVD
jgi:hypothetical protein